MNIKEFFTKKQNIIFLAVLCTFLWGSAYPAIKIGYEMFLIPPEDLYGKMAFAGYRFTLSGILVLSLNYMLFKSVKLPSKEDVPKVFLLGILLTGIHYTFFYIGLSNTTGVNGAILNSTGAFFSVILAHYIYSQDKLTISKTLGCILGFAGVATVSLSDGIFKIDLNFFGDGFIVLAAFVSSIGFIYSKRLSKRINTVTLTGFQLLFGGGMLIIISALNGARLSGFDLQSTSLLIYMAFLTAAAFTLWTTLFKYNKVGQISVYKFLIPVFGTVLSGIFLGEKFVSLKNLLALALVSTGIYLVNSPAAVKMLKYMRKQHQN
jgi:drug/metabolite transporter (DMT)-like permease